MISLIKGTYQWLFAKKVLRVLMLGLDGSGKTVKPRQTLLEQLKKFNGQRSIPIHKISSTIGLNIAKIQLDRAEITIWDLGGKEDLRSLWPSYYPDTQVFVFVLDGSDLARLPEARDVFTMISAELGSVPTLIVVNKHDKESCMSLGHAQEELRTSARAVFVSAVTQEGLSHLIHWLAQLI